MAAAWTDDFWLGAAKKSELRNRGPPRQTLRNGNIDPPAGRASRTQKTRVPGCARLCACFACGEPQRARVRESRGRPPKRARPKSEMRALRMRKSGGCVSAQIVRKSGGLASKIRFFRFFSGQSKILRCFQKFSRESGKSPEIVASRDIFSSKSREP